MKVEARVHDVRLTAEVILLGEDLCVAVTGGDRPHLGCAALALPHPGITDPGVPSATVSTLNRPAHRDDQLAVPIAKTLSAALGRPTAVVCGVHFDRFTPQLAQDALLASQALCREILEQLGSPASSPQDD